MQGIDPLFFVLLGKRAIATLLPTKKRGKRYQQIDIQLLNTNSNSEQTETLVELCCLCLSLLLLTQSPGGQRRQTANRKQWAAEAVEPDSDD